MRLGPCVCVCVFQDALMGKQHRRLMPTQNHHYHYNCVCHLNGSNTPVGRLQGVFNMRVFRRVTYVIRPRVDSRLP